MADYPYIFGLFRSLEGKLLNPNDIERMVDAPDATAAFRVFNDTEYADNLLEVKPEEFKKALNDDLKQTRDLYEKVSPDNNLLEFLFSDFDYHNIKLIFKEKYTQKNLKAEEINVGICPSEKIRNTILGEKKEDLPKHLAKDIEKCLKEFEKSNEPHHIDTFIDKLMFSHKAKSAQSLNNKFISRFLALQTDLANIKIFLRLKRLNKESKKLAAELMTGGQINAKDFAAAYEKETKEALVSFCIHFNNKFREIIDEYLKEESLWKLEKAFENYELEYLKETKRFNYGPQMAIAYFYANKNALRQVRLIMTGKLNGIPPAEIRERLRNIW